MPRAAISGLYREFDVIKGIRLAVCSSRFLSTGRRPLRGLRRVNQYLSALIRVFIYLAHYRIFNESRFNMSLPWSDVLSTTKQPATRLQRAVLVWVELRRSQSTQIENDSQHIRENAVLPSRIPSVLVTTVIAIFVTATKPFTEVVLIFAGINVIPVISVRGVKIGV